MSQGFDRTEASSRCSTCASREFPIEQGISPAEIDSAVLPRSLAGAELALSE